MGHHLHLSTLYTLLIKIKTRSYAKKVRQEADWSVLLRFGIGCNSGRLLISVISAITISLITSFKYAFKLKKTRIHKGLNRELQSG